MSLGWLTFDPALPGQVLALLGVVSLLVLVLAARARLAGAGLRGLALAALLAALAGPQWQTETRSARADIVIVLVDASASQGLRDRTAQSEAASARLAEALAGFVPAVEADFHVVPDTPGAGTNLLTALAEAAARHDPARLAGAILITDGQVHDADRLSSFPAPVHVLLTGRPGDWDRRITVESAPAYGIVGEPVQITLRIDDDGAAPGDTSAQVIASLDGGPPQAFTLPLGESVPLTLTIRRAGANLLDIHTPEQPGELTGLNNRIYLPVNGVRDRLRVLLVSGEPHAGERTWRNLLRADPAVDLVHFTILRPPGKQDGVPYDELSLIAFPTHELFTEKLYDFDLIIFDRFRRQGVLQEVYLQNIAQYVVDGGAVLLAVGDDYAGVESLYRSALRSVLPLAPTGRVIEQGYHPALTDTGVRHPVTEGLEGANDPGTETPPAWGRWFRQVETEILDGQTLVTGARGLPLLQVARVGEGRVGLMASDQVWLWARGYEGGGPHRELLRRLAHWLMQEPELEEDVLRGHAQGGRLTIERRQVQGSPGEVVLTAPSGDSRSMLLEETAPGLFTVTVEAAETGLYTITEGERVAVVATGPATPQEFLTPLTTAHLLAPLAGATGGAVLELSDGVPDLRRVRAETPTHGRGWLGLVRRDAHAVLESSRAPLVPGWVWLALAASLTIAAWRIEGR